MSHQIAHEFRDFYNRNYNKHEQAIATFVNVLRAITTSDYAPNPEQADIMRGFHIHSISGRVKDPEECIQKFRRKYLDRQTTQGGVVADYITDLLGLRIVCLYESDIPHIRDLISQQFTILDETDKIKERAQSEDSFGYKSLHLDVCFNDQRLEMPEYHFLKGMRFELQIRTIIQDAWSVMDHKIKYKKHIPLELKRRINAMAAMFEMTDAHFDEIKTQTAEDDTDGKGE